MILKLPPANTTSRRILMLSALNRKNQESVTDPHHGHYERNFLTGNRAMYDFLLKPEHLNGLRVTQRRSPIENAPPVKVYWRTDIESKSKEVWGSLEVMQQEKERLKLSAAEDEKDLGNILEKIFVKKKRGRKLKFDRENWPVRAKGGLNQSAESGKVVVNAIVINSLNTGVKCFAWFMSGSHAMFSEMIHSAADTMNQVCRFGYF